MDHTELKFIDILIVDDHQMFIDGVKLLLKKNQRINQIFEAQNGKTALKILKEQHINFVITDVNMPEMTGLELTRIIKTNYPKIKIIILSMYNDNGILKEIINSKAEGYILKNTVKAELFNAINKIANGGTYYNNEVHQNFVEE